MSLSPTDFVAVNVEVMLKYTLDNTTKWCTGVVSEVHEYGVEDGHHYVECAITFDDDLDTTVEVLYDYDYLTNSEDAWKFTSNYSHLVDNVINVVLVRAVENEVDGSVATIDTDSDDSYYDTDNEEDDKTSGSDYSYEEFESDEDIVEIPQIRKKSFFNKLGATIWTFSPLIAGALFVYTARDDIINAFKNKYC